MERHKYRYDNSKHWKQEQSGFTWLSYRTQSKMNNSSTRIRNLFVPLTSNPTYSNLYEEHWVNGRTRTGHTSPAPVGLLPSIGRDVHWSLTSVDTFCVFSPGHSATMSAKLDVSRPIDKNLSHTVGGAATSVQRNSDCNQHRPRRDKTLTTPHMWNETETKLWNNTKTVSELFRIFSAHQHIFQHVKKYANPETVLGCLSQS